MEVTKQRGSVAVYQVVRTFVSLSYPACVYAANNALGTQFEGYTPATIAILALLVSVGGITGMLHRLKSEYELRGEVKHLKLFVTSNLFGAVVGGALALLLGEGGGWPGWLLAITILIASFAGTLLVERAWKAVAKKYLPIEDTPENSVEPPRAPTIDKPAKPGNEGKFD